MVVGISFVYYVRSYFIDMNKMKKTKKKYYFVCLRASLAHFKIYFHVNIEKKKRSSIQLSSPIGIFMVQCVILEAIVAVHGAVVVGSITSEGLLNKNC